MNRDSPSLALALPAPPHPLLLARKRGVRNLNDLRGRSQATWELFNLLTYLVLHLQMRFTVCFTQVGNGSTEPTACLRTTPRFLKCVSGRTGDAPVMRCPSGKSRAQSRRGSPGQSKRSSPDGWEEPRYLWAVSRPAGSVPQRRACLETALCGHEHRVSPLCTPWEMPTSLEPAAPSKASCWVVMSILQHAWQVGPGVLGVLGDSRVTLYTQHTYKMQCVRGACGKCPATQCEPLEVRAGCSPDGPRT